MTGCDGECDAAPLTAPALDVTDLLDGSYTLQGERASGDQRGIALRPRDIRSCLSRGRSG
jgi:hypothetical protein